MNQLTKGQLFITFRDIGENSVVFRNNTVTDITMFLINSKYYKNNIVSTRKLFSISAFYHVISDFITILKEIGLQLKSGCRNFMSFQRRITFTGLLHLQGQITGKLLRMVFVTFKLTFRWTPFLKEARLKVTRINCHG